MFTINARVLNVNEVQVISFSQLALGFLPVAFVLVIYYRWSLAWMRPMQAVLRMLLQLLLIGYLLTYIFEADSPWIVMAVVVVMVLASSWIALGVIEEQRKAWFLIALVAIAVGGGVVFCLVIFSILQLKPWYLPRYSIPLAGMIFANSMNSISLAADRYISERNAGREYEQARGVAFNTAMIPVVNSLLAVGLVSLPGMMTGQILSGVSPLIAVRYQIMVMCMIMASSGISTAVFLMLCRHKLTD